MKEESQLFQLGAKVWEFRKQNGFSKKLPVEFQKESAAVVESGITVYAVAKALGLNRNTVAEWVEKFSAEELTEDKFAEVAIIEKPRIEIKLSTEVQGCRVEIYGNDFSLLQRLSRKIGG